MFEAINRVASLEKMQVITAIPGSKVGGLRFFFPKVSNHIEVFQKDQKGFTKFSFSKII